MPPANPDSWSPADLRLAAALQRFVFVAAMVANPHFAAVQQLIPLIVAISRWTSWLGWLASGSRKKTVTIGCYGSAVSDLSSGSASDALTSLRSGLVKANCLANALSSESVKSQWVSSQASLSATLERFIADNAGPAERDLATFGLRADGLSPQLAKLIESRPLDVSLIKRDARIYQSFGARFALTVGRGLLGDEMGLGKTIEALMAIGHAISAEGKKHHLVICPAQVVDSWLREIGETTKGVHADAFRQPGRDLAYDSWRHDGGILVVSYEQAATLSGRELPKLGFVIADEAHFIKNPEARRTKATQDLVARGERVLLMGGTLLENKAEELIFLAGVANPEFGQQLRGQFGDGRTALQDAERFRRAIGSIYLRRN